MNFNTDPIKQAQEVTFSRKTKKLRHPPKLAFENHISKVISKISKTYKEPP